MAIIIGILEDELIVVSEELTLRDIKYTATDSGAMYYFSSGEAEAGVPLTPETALYPPSTVIAQYLYDQAAAHGTVILDEVTWVYIEKKRKTVYRSGWAVVRNEVGDEAITNIAPNWNYQTHILQQLAVDTQLAQNFQANAWRLGLIVDKATAITPSVINGMTGLQRQILYLLTLSFMGLGHGIGVDGSFILDEVLP